MKRVLVVLAGLVVVIVAWQRARARAHLASVRTQRPHVTREVDLSRGYVTTEMYPPWKNLRA